MHGWMDGWIDKNMARIIELDKDMPHGYDLIDEAQIIQGGGVDIKMLVIKDDRIEAEIINVDNFWAERGFEMGMILVFYQTGLNGEWTIKEPKELPWFILDMASVTFEHYR